MRKIFLLLTIFVLLTSCYELHAQDQNIDFVAFPNGTLADSRIAPEIVDIIIRRFYAIENGDIQAFRATGGSVQDGADMYQHAGFIIKYFGDIIGGLTLIDYVNDLDNWDKNGNILYRDYYPPQKRNMWASLERIEIIEVGSRFGMRAEILNYEGGTLFYYIGTKLIFNESKFIDWTFDTIERLSRLSGEWSFGGN